MCVRLNYLRIILCIRAVSLSKQGTRLRVTSINICKDNVDSVDVPWNENRRELMNWSSRPFPFHLHASMAARNADSMFHVHRAALILEYKTRVHYQPMARRVKLRMTDRA